MADSESNDVMLSTSVYATSNFTDEFSTNLTNTTYTTLKTSQSHIEPCDEKHAEFYCFNNGMCQWISGINAPSCVCVDDYEGERCEFKILKTAEGRLFGENWEEFIIGTIFGIVVLLTLMGAIIYVVRKRKQAQATRRHGQEQADEFIQSNYPLSDVEQHDANQNKSTDKYIPLATTEVDMATIECETLKNAFQDTQNNSSSFKLQDPPFTRRASNHSVCSTTKESAV